MPTINISFTAGPLQLQASRGLFSLESPPTSFNVTGGGGGGTLTVVTSSFPNGLVGQLYSNTLSATGGTAPYSWNLVSAIPNTDLWIQVANSAIYGYPQMTELESLVIQVTDSTGATAQASLTLFVTA